MIPAVSTSIGGFVGEFNWGPVLTTITVSSENQLGSVFGTPDPADAHFFLTAAAFLKYGNTLKVHRVPGDGMLTASTGATKPLIYSKDHPINGAGIPG